MEKAQEAGVKATGRNMLHKEVTSLFLVSDWTWFPYGKGKLLSTKHRPGPGAGWPPGLTIALALASASVLPVALVSIVSAVCPFLRGGQQLPCLLLVLSDKRLRFLLLQLPVCHLIHVVAFFRQREVGCKSKREACGPEKYIIKTISL